MRECGGGSAAGASGAAVEAAVCAGLPGYEHLDPQPLTTAITRYMWSGQG